MKLAALPQFCLHLLKGRWMVIVVSFYIMSFAGATYIFGIYSSFIKAALNYDQETIDTLSFFKDLGANVGIMSGLLGEVMPAWAVLGVGAGMNVFGYLMIWLVVTKKLAKPPIWHMYVFMCMGANSQTFANTGVLVTCVKNFPHSRGVVLGLLKGFVGLSGAIFTQVYHALYGQDPRGVILLVAWLPSIVSLLFMFFVRPMSPQMAHNDGKHFFSFLYLALLLAGFLMIIIVVENQVHLPPIAFKVLGVLTLLFVLSNLWIAVRAELEKYEALNEEKKPNLQNTISSSAQDYKMHTEADSSGAAMACFNEINGEQIESAQLKPPNDDKVQRESTSNKPSKSYNHVEATPRTSLNLQQAGRDSSNQIYLPDSGKGGDHKLLTKKSFFSNWPKRGDDFTIPQALVSLDMWILFVATTCGVGSTLTAIDNMGQIGASLGYSSISISTFVSLISIWNFLGRVISGFVSEMLLQRYRFPRTLVLTIVLALACAGHLLIAFPVPGSLYIASILVGLCFGAQWPVLFAVISELFGLKYYSTLYNLGAVASPLGSYILNVRVAGYLYDMEARKQHVTLLSTSDVSLSSLANAPTPAMSHLASSDLLCYGAQCFRMTFLIMTAVSLFGSLVSLILVLRTKNFYNEDIYARFRKPEDKASRENAVITTTELELRL